MRYSQYQRRNDYKMYGLIEHPHPEGYTFHYPHKADPNFSDLRSVARFFTNVFNTDHAYSRIYLP